MLIVVHLIIAAHVLHWLLWGRTLGPLEPSESIATLVHGHITAGTVLFGLAILTTAVLGRYFCGWACHFLAIQDLSAWFLTRLGVPTGGGNLTSLVVLPLLLAIYVFVVPAAYRIVVSPEPYVFSTQLTTTDLWATFPGVLMTLVTFLICGCLFVWVFGSRAFCRYGCPYGVVLKTAAMRPLKAIVASDACQHCGSCTAACNTHINVAQEISHFGQVVSSDCLRCMDCVAACPTDALYLGTSQTRISMRSHFRHLVPRSFVELRIISTAIIAFFVFEGLYDRVPVLLAAGMAVLTATAVERLVSAQRIKNHSGMLTSNAKTVLAALVVIFCLHSAAVQLAAMSAKSAYDRLELVDGDIQPANLKDTEITTALFWNHFTHHIALVKTDDVLWRLAHLNALEGNHQEAVQYYEVLVRRQPANPAVYIAYARTFLRNNMFAEAEQRLRKALILDDRWNTRLILARVMMEQGQVNATLEVLREGTDHWQMHAARLLLEYGYHMQLPKDSAARHRSLNKS